MRVYPNIPAYHSIVTYIRKKVKSLMKINAPLRINIEALAKKEIYGADRGAFGVIYNINVGICAKSIDIPAKKWYYIMYACVKKSPFLFCS